MLGGIDFPTVFTICRFDFVIVRTMWYFFRYITRCLLPVSRSLFPRTYTLYITRNISDCNKRQHNLD